MKNFKFLLVAAVVFAAGSAFTTVKEKSTEQIYVKVNGQNVPIEQASGNCISNGAYCQFTLDGTTEIPLDSNRHFQPN